MNPPDFLDTGLTHACTEQKARFLDDFAVFFQLVTLTASSKVHERVAIPAKLPSFRPVLRRRDPAAKPCFL